MKFFKNLFPPLRPSGPFYPFSVKCSRCGEIIQGQVHIYNEPSMEQDEKGKYYYTCRKVVIGNGHCFQQIEVVIKFDEGKRVIDREIKGGKFIEDLS